MALAHRAGATVAEQVYILASTHVGQWLIPPLVVLAACRGALLIARIRPTIASQTPVVGPGPHSPWGVVLMLATAWAPSILTTIRKRYAGRDDAAKSLGQRWGTECEYQPGSLIRYWRSIRARRNIWSPCPVQESRCQHSGRTSRDDPGGFSGSDPILTEQQLAAL